MNKIADSPIQTVISAGKMEDFFKLLKQGLNMNPIHKYTPKSVKKTVYLNVFLGSLIISRGFYSKTAT